MKKLLILLFSATITLIDVNGQDNIFPPTGNAGIGTSAPSAYGHGGTNRILEIKNTNTANNSQAQLVLSSNSSEGSLGGITWVSNAKRTGFIGNSFGNTSQTFLQTKIAFYASDKSGTLAERFIVQGDGNVGIGTSNPNAPLSFPAVMGKKITLYPGNTGDVGFGVAGNRLQIYSDNPNADVAIGFDAAGTFNERFAVKPNGALAVKFSTGNTGQVLTSGGSASSAEWKSPTNFIFQNSISGIQTMTFTVSGNSIQIIPLFPNSISLNGRSKILINYQVLWNGKGTGCPVFCPPPSGFIDVLFDGTPVSRTAFNGTATNPNTISGSILFTPTATTGTHTIDLRVTSTSAHDISITGATQGSINFGATNMSILIITE
jgi:hypothetical protein